MSENEDILPSGNEPEIVVETAPIVSTPAVLVITLGLMAVSGLAGYLIHQQAPSNDVVQIENARAAKAQAEYQTECQKRVSDLQVEVVKQCVAKGNIPIFVNGNVDCKVIPK